MSEIFEVDDQTFEAEVLGRPGAVLVEFWGGWCKPCRDQEASTSALAEELEGTLGVYRVDVDCNRGTVSRFGVRGVPSLLVFRDGQLLDRHVGKMNLDELRTFVMQAGDESESESLDEIMESRGRDRPAS